MQAEPTMCYFQPAHEITEAAAEEAMKDAQTGASQCMGELIAVGQ